MARRLLHETSRRGEFATASCTSSPTSRTTSTCSRRGRAAGVPARLEDASRQGRPCRDHGELPLTGYLPVVVFFGMIVAFGVVSLGAARLLRRAGRSPRSWRATSAAPSRLARRGCSFRSGSTSCADLHRLRRPGRVPLPWVLSLRGLGMWGVGTMVLFLAILSLGWVYAYGRRSRMAVKPPDVPVIPAPVWRNFKELQEWEQLHKTRPRRQALGRLRVAHRGIHGFPRVSGDDHCRRVPQLARKSSIWPVTFGLACCAIEMMATSPRDSTSSASAWCPGHRRAIRT